MPNTHKTLSGTEFAGIGVQFAVTVVVFAGIGAWLNQRFSTSWPLIVCVFVGAGGGFYSMYRRVTAAQRGDRQPEGDPGHRSGR